MAKFQPWLKMWVEWTDDPKMLSLSLAEQGAWWRLVTLAKKCAADGFLVKGRRAPLSLNEIAATMRFITKADRKVLDSMVEKMVELGSLHWNSDILVVTHFADRQAKTTSETAEAVRERVRKYRERKSSPPQTPSIIEREERRGEVTPLHSVTSNGNSVTSEPALAKIATLHEQDFGLITPVLSEKFKDFVQNYRGPVDWIDLAFAEAVQLKKRRWAYVEAILYSWQEKGGPHADRRESGAERQRPGADQRDPIETWKAAGWDVLGDEPETTKAGDQD